MIILFYYEFVNKKMLELKFSSIIIIIFIVLDHV